MTTGIMVAGFANGVKFDVLNATDYIQPFQTTWLLLIVIAKKVKEEHRCIPRQYAVSDIQQDCPLVLCIWALHTQTDLNMICCRSSEMLKISISTFWFLPNQNVSSTAFILLCGCASALGSFVQVSQHLKPESNFIKWQTASEFESVCRVRWVFKVQQDYVKVRAQIEHTYSNRFLGGGCQGNGFLNRNCREGKNTI